MRNDADRISRLQLEGFMVVQFTYQQVVVDPTSVVSQTIAALATAG